MNSLSELKKELEKRKRETRKRLADFKQNWEKNNSEVFSELVFCLCTPQSNALNCSEAGQLLKEKGLLVKGKKSEVKKCLQGRVRFHNNKTKYILLAQKLFSMNDQIRVKEILKEHGIEKNHLQAREWLVRNVRGLGFKEASHFLRNIGFYENVAILDRHILKNLVELGVIPESPSELTEKKYLEIEKELIQFCKRQKIKPEELDLVLWAHETGFVFK